MINHEENLLRYISEEVNDGWWKWNVEDEKMYFSPGFWSKVIAGQFNESCWKEFVHEEDLKVFLINLKKFISESTFQILKVKMRFRIPNGKWKIFELKGKKYKGAEEESVSIVGVLNDITILNKNEEVLKQRNKELIKSNNELEKFAYVASHDLKAPLRGISNLCFFLEEDLGDYFNSNIEGTKVVQGHLARIKDQALRMETLIKGVLEYSRIDSNDISIENVNLKELLHGVALDLNLEFGKKLVLEDKVKSLDTDSFYLSQVLSNLISNAHKYHDHKNHEKIIVKVENSQFENFVLFYVEDNGPGIEEKHQERIFEMFQTLNPKNDFESTGIGLTLVKKIVEKFGGKITVESKLGEGAIFKFTWPRFIENDLT